MYDSTVVYIDNDGDNVAEKMWCYMMMIEWIKLHDCQKKKRKVIVIFYMLLWQYWCWRHVLSVVSMVEFAGHFNILLWNIFDSYEFNYGQQNTSN